jgi:CPA2 family monovalent cation:H+ antiporter-2
MGCLDVVAKGSLDEEFAHEHPEKRRRARDAEVTRVEDNPVLILTLAVGFIGALTFGYITHRLGWSPIVGYLLAGVLVGPHTPGFVADKHLADQLAEVGVILLMFGVGLHFHLKDLLAVRTVAITGAICQSAIATLLGAAAATAFGWEWPAGIVFGLSLSVASTVVLTRVLVDNDALLSPTGRIAIGWLVMEDVFTVFVLVLLPVVTVASAADQATSVPVAVASAILKLAAFVVFTLVAGGRVIPWLLNKIAETHSRELFTLSVLAIALGIAVASTYVFGVSMALGAFLAGMVVGQSDFSGRAGAEALPMRDAFAVMFFLSVGMLLDPWQVLAAPLLILATLAIVMIGKPLAAITIVALLGYSSRIGLGVAIALAQIGEFSFLLAVLGRDLGVLPEAAMNPIVTAAIVSIMLNPMLYRTLGSLEAWLARHPRLWRLLNRGAHGDLLTTVSEARPTPAYRAVVVGYGPIGQTMTRLLRERGIEATIIEMNVETVRGLRRQGQRAVYGDANQANVLEEAGIVNARTIILSASGAAGAAEAIREARRINPRIHVVARADYLGQAASLLGVGANEVVSGEGEVVLAMTDSILRHLGATPDQLDEERARIRAELFHRGE